MFVRTHSCTRRQNNDLLPQLVPGSRILHGVRDNTLGATRCRLRHRQCGHDGKIVLVSCVSDGNSGGEREQEGERKGESNREREEPGGREGDSKTMSEEGVRGS